MSTRTRFAPSPTGYLHIGGVRTALFCWLLARKEGGQYILRIDDTDQQRNMEQALAPILNGFLWLGLNWDEGPLVLGPHAPYFQSQRLPHYQKAVEQLLGSGHAYRDFATTEELQAERDAAQKEGKAFLYSRRWMAETCEQQERFRDEGRQAVVRLKMPREGSLVIDDLVRGRVEFQWAQEQDHVIQRADGTCLYHLASVVDDQEFGITHVVRAEEHLSNTPRQAFIAQSLGYPLPRYAHLPYVAEPGSKTKLSKRKLDKYLKAKSFADVYQHGLAIAQRLNLPIERDVFNPVVVDFYQQVGYLPEAIVNYLLLLGWSLDDKTEYFTREEMIAAFTLDRVVKAPASFDPDKLVAFQAHYMSQLGLDDKVERVTPFLVKAGLMAPLPHDDTQRQTVRAIVAACGDRIKVAGDIIALAEPFLQADQELTYDEQAFQKRVNDPQSAALLAKFRQRLAELETFNVESLEAALKQFLEAEGIKIGQIIHAIRVATTGQAVGPGLYDCLAILGKDRALARIDRALAMVGQA